MGSVIEEQKAKVDEMIRKLQVTKEITIDPRATTIRVYDKVAHYHREIMSGLMDAIHEYNTSYDHLKRSEDYYNKEKIHHCLFWIDQADAYKLFIPPELEELRSEVAKKNEEIARLSQEIQEVTKSHDALVEEHNKLRDDLIKVNGQLEESRGFIDKYMKWFPKSPIVKQQGDDEV